MQRLKCTIAYDGRPFQGWQSQASGNTVQDLVEGAFAAIAGAPVRVHGAGRTDAGVHALGQCAHADVPANSLDPAQWTAALNSHLPPTIRVLRCRAVSGEFHARFSARGKIYRYRIWNDRILLPLELGRAWHVPQEVDSALLEAAAREFVGTHDFADFSANRGRPEADTHRTIYAVTVRQRGRAIEIEVDGSGFLYKMVRMMVGAMVRCGTRRDTIDALRARLCREAGTAARSRQVAPPEGLILVRIRY